MQSGRIGGATQETDAPLGGVNGNGRVGTGPEHSSNLVYVVLGLEFTRPGPVSAPAPRTMLAQNDSPDTSATLSKESQTCPGRDGHKTAHNHDSREQSNNPPNHGVPTHGVGRFLWECDKRTPVSELGKLYERWQSDSEQADLGRWGE